MHKKKKILLFGSLVLLFAFLLYSIFWLYYYKSVCKPHITAELSFQEDEIATRYKCYASEPDENYNRYFLFIPKFGKFNCYFSANSSIGINKSDFTKSPDGSIEYNSTYNMSGALFDYSMLAEFGLDGNIECFKFNVTPNPQQKKYAQTAFLILNDKGELLNGDSITEKEIAIYDDAYIDLMGLIKTAKKILKIN